MSCSRPAASRSHRWAIVLAAGDGTRLRSISRDVAGRPLPKQYWSPDSGPSLLRRALVRADRLVPREHVVTVVAEHHGHWWRAELEDWLPPENVIVQPSNRGTAAGILLPLLVILGRDPEAQVMIVPSDHAVVNEWTLASVLEEAFVAVEASPDRLILLGMTVHRPEAGFGWIIPRRVALGSQPGPQAVRTFVEKPSASRAAALLQDGALVSSFLLVADAETLHRMVRSTLPDLTARLEHLVGDSASPREGLSSGMKYQALPCHDFSADVLASDVARLDVLRVPACGWTDLGTPERVRRWVSGASRNEPARHRSPARPPQQRRSVGVACL